jgi:hypothetical protein
LMTNQAGMDTWMNQGIREVINVLPGNMLMKCSAQTIRSADEGTTFDLDSSGRVLYVTRKSASDGYYVPCRMIPSMYSDLANDSSDLMYYATVTDPVYWTESNSSNAGTLFIKPTPTNAQPAKVFHISYATVDASSVSIIANFPDEAEHIVVLYAAIKAAEALLAQEEDGELYKPIIGNLVKHLYYHVEMKGDKYNDS